VVLTILVYGVIRVGHHGHNIICELLIPLIGTLASVDPVSTSVHTWWHRTIPSIKTNVF
jgi:hypothetical protein